MSLLLKFIFLFLITHLPKIDCWEIKSCDSNPPCKFNETFLSNNTASKFPKNCSTVCGILLINGTTDLSAEQLTELFKNMRILVGGLHIRNATFKNLRFLSDHTRYPMYDAQLEITYNSELRELGLLNLTTIKSSVVVIYRNEKLKKLNLPKLETAKFLENRTIQLQMASAKFPEFCIKTQELDAFTRKRNKCDLIINSNICIPKNAPKVCTVPTVGCERLIGDLNITKGFDVRKVESLKRLYGTLNITNTDFNDFRFLGNLTHILCLLHKPALFVVGNKNLTNMEFPNLRRIDTSKDQFAQFADNSQESHADFKSCYALRKAALREDFVWPEFGSLRSCEEIESPSTSSQVESPSTPTKNQTCYIFGVRFPCPVDSYVAL
ncbi:hypothetical protein L3Y34_002953 [Caenorhabditis briggsae]|uniref:Receptor L-domain domain-containing protein n=1 Tax=Caenorhabditis briggsae TaxID=6238 RepID=A0AAE9AC30_CAEBR|nr:hypothetical protein L3Y34_002953 [Caenorhabditis briggsae]